MSDIPASWQPDPRGRHEYRYWDGSQWTDHVSDKGEVSTDPVDGPGEPAAEAQPEAAPTEVQETPAAAEPTPEPAAAEPDPEPVVAEPDPEPVAAEPAPEPVVAEPAPEPVVAEPAPAAASVPPVASSAPPGGGATQPATAQTDAKAAAQEVLHSKSPELATILSAVVPGSGHFYLGTDKVPLAAGLLVATVAALVLSWMSFLMFIIGFVLWAGAAVFALTDLRGGVRGLENTALPRNVVGIVLIAAGALLVISLLLPYYHLSYSVEAFGVSQSGGGNINGFQAFGIIDLVLLVVGIGAIVGGAASLGLGPVTTAELPKWLPTAIAVGGAVAAVLILFRMFIDPAGDLGGFSAPGAKADADVGRGFGIWFGLWASLVLVIANAGILRSLSNRN
jgi:hypothetical protein